MRSLLLCLLLCATPAWADSIQLQVTGGSIGTASYLLHGDYGYTLLGENFRLNGSEAAFPFSSPVTTGISTAGFRRPTFTLDGVVLLSVNTSTGVSYGSFTLTQDRPFVVPNLNGQPFGTLYIDTTPFTMVAHFDFGDGYDLMGSGIAEYRQCHVCQNEVITMSWRFNNPQAIAVPEPSAAVLLVVGLVGLLAVKVSACIP